MFPARPLLLASLGLFLGALPAYSDPDSEASPDGETGVRGPAVPGAAESGKKDASGKKPVRPAGESLPKAPKVAESWNWKEAVDPDLAPSVDWSFEDRLDLADWDSPTLLRVNGEPITWDMLESWLYLTVGQDALRTWEEYLVARDMRKRMGLPPVEPFSPKDMEAIHRMMVQDSPQDLAGEVMTALHGSPEIARFFVEKRVQTYQALFGGEWTMGSMPPSFQSLFADYGDGNGLRTALKNLPQSKSQLGEWLFLQEASGLAMTLARISRIYTPWDHEDGLGGIATVVLGDQDDSFQGGELPSPWNQKGEKRPITLKEMRAILPVPWTESQKRHALRDLVCARLLRKDLDRLGKWPTDEERWDNHWTVLLKPTPAGMMSVQEIYLKDYGVPSLFQIRVDDELRAYEKVDRGDEIRDPRKMQDFLDSNRWFQDKWQFYGEVIAIPFVDPLTGFPKSVAAEEEALQTLRRYQTRLDEGADFHFLAVEAARNFPPTPRVASSILLDWFNDMAKSAGRISGQRQKLRDRLFESDHDIWMRGTSLAEAFVRLKPGEVGGPWKGATAWYLMRMYRGNRTRPPQTLEEKDVRVDYLDYQFQKWSSAVLRKAGIKPVSN
ncbi:MAG: hypothetical protein ACE5H3_06875 [Planctomycetota bacterium]